MINLGYNVKLDYHHLADEKVRLTVRELYASMDVGGNGFFLMGRKITDWGKAFYKRPAAVLDPERTVLDINDNFNKYKGIDQVMVKYFFSNLSIAAVGATNLDMKDWEKNFLWTLKESTVISQLELSLIQGRNNRGGYFSGITFTFVPTDMLEFYGEGIYYEKSKLKKISGNSIEEYEKGQMEYTLGAMLTLPWHNVQDIRWIVEFYFNSNGWDRKMREKFQVFLGENYWNMFSSDPLLQETASENFLNGTSMFNIDRINRMTLFTVLDNLPVLPGGFYFQPVFIYSLTDHGYIFQLTVNKPIDRYVDFISYGIYFGGREKSVYHNIPYRYKLLLGFRFHL